MEAEPILEELVLEIMARLPAKSIGRFRSVSKRWLSETSDPKFIRTHASLAPVSGFFLQDHIERPTGGVDIQNHIGFPAIHFPRFPAIHIPLDDTPTLSDPSHFVLELARNDLCVVSSCNGIILILSAYGHGYGYEGESRLLSVCNPTTKEHHVVSLPQQPHLSNLHLAFDPSRSAHFKVAGIWKIQESYKIQIYSSETLSWKVLDGVDVGTANLLCRCVYWNGCLVYLDMSSKDSPLYLLDVEGECLGRLPRPRKGICMYFGESGGRLHFIARPEAGTGFDVLEMEAESSEWSVLCRVDIGHIRDVYPEVDRNVLSFDLNEASIWDVYPEVEVDTDSIPFFASNQVSTVYFMREDGKGGDQLLLSIPGKIVAFHVRNGSFTTVCHGLPSKSTYSCIQIYPHAHTLFSLNSGSPQNDWVCWTRSHDKLLIDLMLQHSPDGRLKGGIIFESRVWGDMVRKFNEVTKLNYDFAQLKRRWLLYIWEYQRVKNLLESRMGFKWDDSLQMVIAGDATWAQYIEAYPVAIAFRGRKVPFSELKRIFGYV